MGVCYEALGVSLSKTAPGADLGGSSKYSNESFEDRSGEGFHVNSSSSFELLLVPCSLSAGVLFRFKTPRGFFGLSDGHGFRHGGWRLG